MLSSLALVAVAVAAATVGQADKPPSHQEQLKDVAWWVGTWDVKGKMADGKEFKGQHSWRWSLDKNFLTGDMTSSAEAKSTVEAQFVVGWDPTKKEVIGWEFWRDGFRGTFTITEKGTHLEGAGEGPHGQERWVGVTDLSEDKNSYSYQATIKRAAGTEAVFQFNAVRRTVEKKQVAKAAAADIPPKARKALQFFVGKFTGETYINGEKSDGGTDERRWVPGKHCILMSGSGMEAGVERHFAGMSGWDGKGQQLVETWHASDGMYVVIRYPLAGMKEDTWKGNFTVTYGDGRSYDGDCVLDIEDNGWIWTAQWKEDGKEMVRKGVTRRVK